MVTDNGNCSHGKTKQVNICLIVDTGHFKTCVESIKACNRKIIGDKTIYSQKKNYLIYL